AKVIPQLWLFEIGPACAVEPERPSHAFSIHGKAASTPLRGALQRLPRHRAEHLSVRGQHGVDDAARGKIEHHILDLAEALTVEAIHGLAHDLAQTQPLPRSVLFAVLLAGSAGPGKE